MANPRKFSEKIALLNQKEAEGNAEFERIMREVSEVSAKVSQAPPRNTNLIATTSAFISRSLPNVNAPINNANNSNNIDEKGDDTSATTLAGLLTTGYNTNDITKNANTDSKVTTRESRGRSVGGGPMRSRSRNIDTSPYGSNNNAYLSPPQESSWRRTSSDSAIHQSLTQAQEMHSNVQSLMLSPRAQKRLSNSQSNSMKNLHQHHQNQSMNQQHSHSQQNITQQSTLLAQQTLMQHQQQNIPQQQHLIMNNLQQDMKSRSVSRLPGIPIYPSQNDELLQIPISNSTGSLPDLTLVHFQQSPLSNPLDPHDQLIAVTTNQSFSMPSTNQTTTNHLPSMSQHQQQMYTQMGNNLDQFSPKHFNNDKGSTSQGLLIQQQGANTNSNFAQQPQQQQSSPIPIDNSNTHQQQQQSPLHYGSYTNQIPLEKMMSYRSNAASPGQLSLSQGNLSKQNSYRSSPNSRPSPGSSPITNIPDLSNSSAPCSPSPQMTGNNGQFESYPSVDTFYLNPTIQQHFEQFSLDWTSLVQSLVDSGCTISAEVKVDSPLPDYNASTNEQNYTQISDNYNGIINDSPNRTNQSPTNRGNASRPSSRANNMNQQQSTTGVTNNSNRQSNNNGSGSSPHSPLGSDQMLAGNNYDNLRSILGSSSPLDGGIMNGINNSNSGVNDIMLGGLGSDSNSKLISSSNPALQNPLMMSTSSPSHQLSQTTAIPEIVFSDYSSGSVCDLLNVDHFLDMGMNTTELQMFENANIIDPTIEENFRRDLY